MLLLAWLARFYTTVRGENMGTAKWIVLRLDGAELVVLFALVVEKC